MHPFGQGNPEPVFGLRSVCLDEPQTFGNGNSNFRFRLATGAGRGIAGIAWGMEPPAADQPVDLALRFSWNHWRGKRYPQVTLVDWK